MNWFWPQISWPSAVLGSVCMLCFTVIFVAGMATGGRSRRRDRSSEGTPDGKP